MTARNYLRILSERDDQEARWGQQDHPDLSGTPATREVWRKQWRRELVETRGLESVQRYAGKLGWDLILLEEVYEALSEANEEKLEEELVQVAAVAVAWLEAIQRRRAAREEAQAWINGE